MKKIILSVLSVLMIFGLIGCSGDLHDVVRIDPNAMEGNWYYTVVDVSAATGPISMIFSDGTNQTNDITGVDVSSGSVAYIWSNTSKDAEVSTRTDCPDKSSLGGAGKVVVYCFSNAPKVNLWAWEGDTNFVGGVWPGVQMDSDTAAALPVATISKIEVTGLPDALVGSELYLAGTIQPEGSWSTPGDNESLKATITDNEDGTCTLTINLNHTYDVGGYQFKFAAGGWTTPEVCGYNADGAANAEVTLVAGNTVIKGVYNSEKGCADDKYLCDWSAE